MAISLTKKTEEEEEGEDSENLGGSTIWTQTFLSEHSYPITCCTTDRSCRYLATGDSVVNPVDRFTPEPSRVIVWDLIELIVVASIEIPLSTATGEKESENQKERERETKNERKNNKKEYERESV